MNQILSFYIANFYFTDPVVRRLYDDTDHYDYEKLVENGYVDKSLPRDMCDTSIMVDGSKYKGQFKKRRLIKDGIGQIIYKDGSMFEGAFKDDDTLFGRWIFTNGYIYEGQMKYHRMHGKGKLKFEDSVVYDGEFINGKHVEQAPKLVDLMDNASINTKSTDLNTPVRLVHFPSDDRLVTEN